MRKRSEPDLLASVLTTATTRGVIDVAQAAALQSIGVEMDAGQRALHSSGDVAADANAARVPGAPAEERRAFNPVIIAYSAGALLVLFALGWFLVDRTAMLFSMEEARRRTEDRDRLTTHYRRRARGDAAADRAAQGAPAAVDTTRWATSGRPKR